MIQKNFTCTPRPKLLCYMLLIMLYACCFYHTLSFDEQFFICTRKNKIKSIPPSPALQNFNFMLFQYSQICLRGIERRNGYGAAWIFFRIATKRGVGGLLPCKQSKVLGEVRLGADYELFPWIHSFWGLWDGHLAGCKERSAMEKSLFFKKDHFQHLQSIRIQKRT